MLTNFKLIKSGNILELFEYKKSIEYGKSGREPGVRKKKEVDAKDPLTFELKLENRKRTLLSSKATLKRLINANAGYWKDENNKTFMPIFLSLTFAENITDIKKANYIFTKFKQRLDYEITKKKGSFLKYAGVIEFQKRGAVHYHIIFFNMPFTEKIYDKINRLWGKGFMIVKSVKDINAVASYICKYMTKGEVDKRLLGQKSYFTSRGLKKPVKILDKNRIVNIKSFIPKSIVSYEKQFISEFCGEIKYTRYDFKDHKIDNEMLDNLLENNLI